jgi:hypothetical protein
LVNVRITVGRPVDGIGPGQAGRSACGVGSAYTAVGSRLTCGVGPGVRVEARFGKITAKQESNVFVHCSFRYMQKSAFAALKYVNLQFMNYG